MITAPTGIPPVDAARGAVIELERVTKVYRTGSISVAALRGVSLTITKASTSPSSDPRARASPRSCTSWVASTSRLLAAYHLAGEDVSDMSETALAEVRNRRIGFVFQQFNLLASLAAWQNVELPVGLRRRLARRAQGARHGGSRAGRTDRSGEPPSR